MKVYIERLTRAGFLVILSATFFCLGGIVAYISLVKMIDGRINEIEQASARVSRGIDKVESAVDRMMRNINGLVSISGTDFIGLASFYDFETGRRTASGQYFDPDALTAAHRTLPIGTVVAVTNLDNQRSIEVRINDRGPFADDRIIDLTPEGARRLGMIRRGLTPVKLKLISMPTAFMESERLTALD